MNNARRHRVREKIFKRDGYMCRYCGWTPRHHKWDVQKRLLTVDHVIPRSRGGTNRQDNLVTACRRCNLRKRDLPHPVFPLLPIPVSNVEPS